MARDRVRIMTADELEQLLSPVPTCMDEITWLVSHGHSRFSNAQMTQGRCFIISKRAAVVWVCGLWWEGKKERRVRTPSYSSWTWPLLRPAILTFPVYI